MGFKRRLPVKSFGTHLAFELLFLMDDFMGFQLEDGVEALAAYFAHETLLVQLSLMDFLYVGDEITFDKERLSTVVTRAHPVLRLLVGFQSTWVF